MSAYHSDTSTADREIDDERPAYRARPAVGGRPAAAGAIGWSKRRQGLGAVVQRQGSERLEELRRREVDRRQRRDPRRGGHQGLWLSRDGEDVHELRDEGEVQGRG